MVQEMRLRFGSADCCGTGERLRFGSADCCGTGDDETSNNHVPLTMVV